MSSTFAAAASPAAPLPWGSRRSDLLLDLAERAVVLLLGGWLAYRFVPTLAAHPLNALLLVSEGLIVVLIAVRRFGRAVNTARAWSLALAGTFLPLLVLPTGEAWLPERLALFMMTLGLLINCSAKLVLQRSFGIVAANRGLERRGPYRLVRHPMYVGYLLGNVAFLGVSFSLWNLAVYAACWLAMILRIGLEEAVLAEDPGFAAYRAQVRWRLVPGIW